MLIQTEKNFFVYIMASKPRGVIYTGVTSNLIQRAVQHREHLLDGFTKRYWVDRLVYYEPHSTAEVAILREKRIKRWRRDWKIALIETDNPTWRDLYAELLRDSGIEV